MGLKELLELRRAIKKKKPKFIRQNRLRKRLNYGWKRPKGMDSKMRLNRKGKQKSAQIGYCSPKEVRGLHKSGLKPVMINNVNELEKLSPKMDGAIISSRTGLKKKLEIIKKASEKGIRLLNIKNAEQFIKEAGQKRAEVKRLAEEKKKKAQKAPKKKRLEEKLSDEEKKESEKQEKDRILTKRA